MKLSLRTNSINAGDLKDRCILLIPSSTASSRGGSTITYSTHSTVWCKARNAGNSRTLQEAQLIFNDAQYFTIRVSSVPITAEWRITFNGNTYIIHTIEDIENRYQYLKILAYSKNL